MTATAEGVYDALLPVVLAEERLTSGGPLSPGEYGEAIRLVTGSEYQAQLAEANARLRQAGLEAEARHRATEGSR
jgi:hypothetical protein